MTHGGAIYDFNKGVASRNVQGQYKGGKVCFVVKFLCKWFEGIKAPIEGIGGLSLN